MAGNSVLHPIHGIGGEEIAGANVLLLRVWTAETAETAKLAWDGKQPWIAMMRQAIVSGGGTLPGPELGSGSLLASRFPSQLSAVRASRRLHALAMGYAEESKGQIFGVAAAIWPSAVLDNAALVRFLQEKAGPAQTLLAAERTATPPNGRKIENATLGEYVLYELAYAHREDASRTAEALLREHQNRVAGSLPLPQQTPARRFAAVSIFVARLSARSRVMAAVLGTLLVITAGVAIARRPAKAPARTGVLKVQTPLVPIEMSNPHQPAAVIPAPLLTTPIVPASPRIDHVKKSAPTTEPTEAVDLPKHGRGDLTSEQVRQIMTRGQNALDRGCYTEAIGFYRRVLEADPRSSSATAGQEKARVRMRLSGENAQCAR